MQKSNVAILGLSALLFSGLAFAQDEPVPAQPAPEAAVVDAPAVAGDAAPVAEQPSLDDYVAAFKLILSEWQTVGWLAGLVALVAFLVMLMRLKFIDNYLVAHDLKWVKALIAAVLGGLAAMFAAVQAGAEWWPAGIVAFISGAVAGFGAVGLHQTVTKGDKNKK